MYRGISNIKGADLATFSFFDKFNSMAQLRGRYVESNWIIIGEVIADGKRALTIPIHVHTNKVMVLYAITGNRDDFNQGRLQLDYIQGDAYSTDDNTIIDCNHYKGHSSTNGFSMSNGGNYMSWAYDILSFTSGTKVNADFVPNGYRVNLKIATCSTEGGTYNYTPLFKNGTLLRVIEIGPGFDALTSPYENEIVPVGLMTTFWNMLNSKFDGMTELPGKRYMNYLIGVDSSRNGNRTRTVQSDTFMSTALLSTNGKVISSTNTYSNVQITPFSTQLELTSIINDPNSRAANSSYPSATNKYADTYWSGADLNFNGLLNRNVITDIWSSITDAGTIGNIGFANQFSGYDETSLSDLYEMYNVFKSSELTSVPICNTVLSLIQNTVSLPFWRRNEDVYVPYGGGIFPCTFRSILDPRFSSEIDPTDYRSGKDIYDTTNEVYIQFYEN